jgi:hypothetical protein
MDFIGIIREKNIELAEILPYPGGGMVGRKREDANTIP